MTSAENSVSKHPNLKILQPPPPPYKARAFGTRDNAPPTPPPSHPRAKKPNYGLVLHQSELIA